MRPDSTAREGLYFHYLPRAASGRRSKLPGRILYIGISTNWAERLAEHWSVKPYLFKRLPLVVVHRPFPPGMTRRQIEQVEAAMIDHYRPPWNNQHNPDHDKQQWIRDQILANPQGGFWWHTVGVRGWALRTYWAGRWVAVGMVGGGTVAMVLG